jgi:hypothetical protein
VKIVVAEFELDVKQDEYGGGNPYRQSQNIDDGIGFVPQ